MRITFKKILKGVVFLLFLFILRNLFLLFDLFGEHEGPVLHIYISSAYYVTDTSSDGKSTNAVRMFALGEKNIGKLDFVCNFDGHIIKPIIKKVGEPDECKFSTYIFDCSTNTKPTNLFLTGQYDTKHPLEITETDPVSRKVVICFSRMFYFEKWQLLLASLEIYKLLDVDLMVIPVSSVIEKVHRILKAYEQEGKVRLKPAVHMPQFPDLEYDPNSETEWFQQVTAYTECLYDHRESADFVLCIDFDDIILPKNFDTLPEELYSLVRIHPRVAVFEFLWTWMETKEFNSTERYSISQMVRESKRVHKTLPNYGKTALRPSRIIQPAIHHPATLDRLDGFLHQTMSANDTLAFHFRTTAADGTPIPGIRNYFTTQTIYSKLDKRLDEFLQRNPAAKKAYSTLPYTYPYLTAMINCYTNIGKKMEVRKLDFCRNPLQCKLKPSRKMPKCVVLTQEHRQTQLTGRLFIATPTWSKFKLRPNCLS